MSRSDTNEPDQEAEALSLLRQSLQAIRAETAGLSASLKAAGSGATPLSARRHTEALAHLIDVAEAQVIRFGGKAAKSGPMGPLGGRRILLVDEGPALLRQLTTLLRGEGAQVIAVRSGTEAVGLMSGEAFDLLITAASLSDLSGAAVITALRALKDSRSATPALAMTSDLTVQCYDALIAAGATRVVTKPLPDTQELLRIAARLMKAQSPPPAPESGEDVPLFDPAPLTLVCQLAGPVMAREILDRLMLDLLETLAAVDRIAPALGAGGTDADLSALRGTTQVLVALAGTAGAPLLLRKVQALDYRLQTEGQGPAASDLTALLSDIRMLTRGAVAAIAQLAVPEPDDGTRP